ncbi:MAG: hypothetical protein QM270_08820 [Bacillota bacterium]|nr:hypothetical protein [Bacillota bacterium]
MRWKHWLRLGLEWLGLALPLAVLCWFFIPQRLLALALGLLLAPLPLHSLRQAVRIWRLERINRRYGLFFQYLYTETGGGRSLETACRGAAAHFAFFYGPNEPFMRELIRLERGLELQQPLQELFRGMAGRTAATEARAVLYLLASSQLLGPRLREILETAATMLGELHRIGRQVAAENARQNLEAVILIILPFALMPAMHVIAAEDLARSRSSGYGLLLLGAALCLSVLAGSLVLRLRAGLRETKIPEGSFLRLRAGLIRSETLLGLGKTMTARLPARYRLRIYRAMRTLLHVESSSSRSGPADREGDVIEQLVAGWVLLRALLFGSLLGLGLLLQLMGRRPPGLFALLVLFIATVLPERQLFVRQERYQLALLASFPLYTALMVQLLRSGFSLGRAILFCSRHMDPGTPIEREFAHFRPALEAGERASSLLTQFASRLDELEAHTVFLLFAQYERFGGDETLGQLERAVDKGWELMKQARRRSGDLQAAAMLLPMLLAMLAVILIGITPALNYFLFAF